MRYSQLKPYTTPSRIFPRPISTSTSRDRTKVIVCCVDVRRRWTLNTCGYLHTFSLHIIIEVSLKTFKMKQKQFACKISVSFSFHKFIKYQLRTSVTDCSYTGRCTIFKIEFIGHVSFFGKNNSCPSMSRKDFVTYYVYEVD